MFLTVGAFAVTVHPGVRVMPGGGGGQEHGRLRCLLPLLLGCSPRTGECRRNGLPLRLSLGRLGGVAHIRAELATASVR